MSLLSEPKYRHLYKIIEQDRQLNHFFDNSKRSYHNKNTVSYAGDNISFYMETSQLEYCGGFEAIFIIHNIGIDDEVREILLRYLPSDIIDKELMKYTMKTYFADYQRIYYIYNEEYQLMKKMKLKDILGDICVYNSYESFIRKYNSMKANRDFYKTFWNWFDPRLK